MPRKDDRTRAPDIFGKPGKSYPDGSLTHPTIVEEHTANQDASTQAFLTAHDRETGALLVEQASSPGDNTDKVTRRLYETLPGPALAGVVMSGEAQGALATTSKQRLRADAAAYSPDWKTLSYSDTPIDANRKERNVTTLPDSAFPILTEYDQDEEMLSLITTTFQVVQASAVSAPTAVAGTITRYKRLDKWRSLKIETVYAVPAGYSEQRFSGQSFPNLFDGYYHSEACGTIMLMRAGFSAMVEIELVVTFSTSFALVSGLTLIPNSFAIGSFRVSDILNDEFTLESNDPDCSYSVTFEASSPSKATYLAYGSTKQVVSGEVVLWKAKIFKTTTLKVKML